MAFTDSEHILYDGTVKITYKDKAHRYFKQAMWDGAWGKMISTKGVTTMMDNVLEKKGLMTWPMGLALRELFGFYDFKNEQGEQLTGFSKGVGTFWEADALLAGQEKTKDSLLPMVQSASKAWQRKKKSGADIGSLVHDAIEHFVTGQPFELTLEQYKLGQEFESEEAEEEWDLKAVVEVKMAILAFTRFTEWWKDKNPTLIGAEQLVYSRRLDYCGTYDGLIELDGKTVLCDWKTSNASTSKDAAAPQGVYYSYFIQSGAYAAALYEMTGQLVDDLLIVSARKDGGFDTVAASDLGLTVQDCIDWWEAVAVCYKLATKTKFGLVNNVKEKIG